jgi:hypothetical protein
MKQKERYTIVIKPSYYMRMTANHNVERLDCKTLKEAKAYMGILTKEEKERAYIYDNVKKEIVK